MIVWAALGTIALAVLALLTVFPASGAGDVAPDDQVIEAVYWALLGTTALVIGESAHPRGKPTTTIGDIFRTLPRSWFDEILTGEADAAAERSDGAGVSPPPT